MVRVPTSVPEKLKIVGFVLFFMDMLLHYFDSIFGPRSDIAVASSDCYLTCLVGTRQCQMWTVGKPVPFLR